MKFCLRIRRILYIAVSFEFNGLTRALPVQKYQVNFSFFCVLPTYEIRKWHQLVMITEFDRRLVTKRAWKRRIHFGENVK